jgi:hypothetical protein
MTTDTNPLGLDFFSFAWFFLTEVMPLSFIIIIVVVVFTIMLVSDNILDRMVRRVIDILPSTNPYA